MTMKIFYRIMTALAVASLIAIAVAASTNQPSLIDRFNSAIGDLSQTQAPIPHEKLHARALEILRDMTVAKDEADAVPLPAPRPDSAPAR